jgi:hypothetical protein
MWYCEFDALQTTGVRYAFSDDGVSWIRNHDNPVLEPLNYEKATAARVLLIGDEWHMWYSHFRALFPVQPRISYAVSDCCPGVAALDWTQFIPAAALAEGAEGSFYQTDVDFSNAGDRPVEYRLVWLPRGEDSSDPTTSATFTLGAGRSVRYANVLSEVFGLERDSLGALAIVSTSPDLLAMSRTYNIPADGTGGTFGQSMAAVKPDEFIDPGDRRRLLFGTQNDEMRTNIGCQNGTSAELSVNVELFDARGVSLGTEVLVLQPWSNDQLNQIFSDYAPTTGYVDVWTEPPNGCFFCYGSVLDNVTSDPTTIFPQ